MRIFAVRLTACIALVHALLVGGALAAGYALPSGGEIAFVSDREGNRDIYVADITRSLLRNITNSEVVEFSPVWSPDGSQIAFAAAPTWGYDANLYVMNANGGQVRALTDFDGNEVVPEWSPDGKQIAFTWNDIGRPQLYVIDVDGTHLRGVGHRKDSREVMSHAWSPDGAHIAQSVLYDGWSIQMTTTDGDFVRRLPIPNTLTQYDIDWSSDGQRLLFTSDFGGEYNDNRADLYVADVETGSHRAVTDGSAYNGFASWTPDGTAIVFTSWRDGNAEIYLMDADGGNPRRLTNHPGTDVTPSWRP